MRRIQIVSMMALIIAVPAATAGSYFSSSATKPCFITGSNGYELSGSKSANHVVRIDNAAAHPSFRIQVVDDAANADFVLVDDADSATTCKSASSVESIRIDPEAAHPEFTVALSREPADYRIFVRSTNYSEQDAAALFAVIWQKAEATGSLRSFAKSD